jgi:SAM-dependent methyltransferase
MDNYQYCARFAARAAEGQGEFTVLDYGCGAGAIVKALIEQGIDTRGCDVFYEGGDYSSSVPAEIANRIHRMEGDRIPFGDATFDLVLSNQVLEHVPDLDVVLGEIARILKPGGICLSLFPHRGVWREGHCNIPLLHRFPKGRARIYYAAALYPIGYYKNGKSRMQWARDFADWLDRWTYYRPYREIAATFAKHLSPPAHIENEWIVERKPIFRFAPRWLRNFIAWKMAGMVFVSRRLAGCDVVIPDAFARGSRSSKEPERDDESSRLHWALAC